mmetsp:Transcript_32656/g.73294  ORF Transcript_32656/g.73294 Transcript_32656/m.73294 type:complete len:227 (-) Transcript_32656:277-957(-)
MIRLRTKLAARHSAAKSLASVAADTPLLPSSYYVEAQSAADDVPKTKTKRSKKKAQVPREVPEVAEVEAEEKPEEPAAQTVEESPPETHVSPETMEAGSLEQERQAETTAKFQEEDGLCLACQSREADNVSSACGHLTFCKACRRRAVHQALEAREPSGKAVKKRKDLSTKELERTVVPCPVCRAEGVLVPLAKYSGKVFGLPENSPGEAESGVSQERIDPGSTAG